MSIRKRLAGYYRIENYINLKVVNAIAHDPVDGPVFCEWWAALQREQNRPTDPVICAVKYKAPHILEMLLFQEACLDHFDRQHGTALYAAVENNDAHMVLRLMEVGAPLFCDPYRHSPSISAAASGFEKGNPKIIFSVMGENETYLFNPLLCAAAHDCEKDDQDSILSLLLGDKIYPLDALREPIIFAKNNCSTNNLRRLLNATEYYHGNTFSPECLYAAAATLVCTGATMRCLIANGFDLTGAAAQKLLDSSYEKFDVPMMASFAAGGLVLDLRHQRSLSLCFGALSLARIAFDIAAGSEEIGLATAQNSNATVFSLIEHHLPKFRKMIEDEKHLLLKKRVEVICIGLQSLELPALVTCAIVDQLFQFAEETPMHIKWNWVTFIKHYREKVLDVKLM